MRGRRKPSEEYETYDAESYASGRNDSGGAVDYDRLFQQTGPTANGGPGRPARHPRDSRNVPASGVGGYSNNRGYPAALDGGYASPPMRRAGGGGQYGYVNSSFSGREGVLQPNGTRHLGPTNTGSGPGVPLSSNATTTFIIPSLANMNSNNSNMNSTNSNSKNSTHHTNNKLRSAPYTKFQVATPPSFSNHQPTSNVGTIPIVQLTASPGPQSLNIATVDREWDRRGSRGSLRSQNSKSSGGGGSTRSRRRSSISRFLGVRTESAWTKWSKDRRASYRRRAERLENADSQEPELDINRVSTPVKKARQEGLKFVHPDLEERYLSADDMNELRRARQQQVHAMRVIEKSRKKSKFPMKAEVKLSEEEWHALQEFWEHRLFIQARFIGMLVSLVAISIVIASIASEAWISHSRHNGSATITEGLWKNCTEVPNEGESCSWTDGRDWQNAVIGLMIFASVFGFLASVLSFCGACTGPLPRKIYYFHSAGEIFFISALSAIIALLIFPISVEIDSSVANHSYGVGYGLGWGGAIFFLAAAICMSLDDLVRECSRSRCCRWCWRGRHGDRGDLRQV